MLAREQVTHLVYNQNYKEAGISRGDVILVTRMDIDSNRIYGRNEETGKVLMINPDKQHSFNPYTLETRQYSAGDRVEVRVKIDDHLIRGRVGVVEAVSNDTIKVKWNDGVDGSLTSKQARFVDHAYAHTTHKEQGQSPDVEIDCISESGAKAMNREGSYVGGSRAKIETIVVTSAKERMLKNAGKEPEKTTSLDLMLTSSDLGKRIAAAEHPGTLDGRHPRGLVLISLWGPRISPGSLIMVAQSIRFDVRHVGASPKPNSQEFDSCL